MAKNTRRYPHPASPFVIYLSYLDPLLPTPPGSHRIERADGFGFFIRAEQMVGAENLDDALDRANPDVGEVVLNAVYLVKE